MKPHPAIVTALILTVVTGGVSISSRAAEPDWKAVVQAIGKSGQLQPGDVLRVGIPLTASRFVRGVQARGRRDDGHG
jgi:hypothetical protein